MPHKLYHAKDRRTEGNTAEAKAAEEATETFVLYTGHDYYNANKLDWVAFYRDLGKYLQFYADYYGTTQDWADQATYTSVHILPNGAGYVFNFNLAYDANLAVLFKVMFSPESIYWKELDAIMAKDGFQHLALYGRE